MPKAVTIFNATTGLDVRADPVRLNPKEGMIVPLAKCVNCSIDDRGRISRREGYDATARTESWHSLFSHGNLYLGVLGTGYLCRIAPDLTYTQLAQVDPSKTMSYCPVYGKVYYGNGENYGYVEGMEAKTWSQDTYDTSILPPTDREFEGPFAFELLEEFSGRMFGVYDMQYIAHSEKHFFGLWDRHTSESKFDSWIRMMQAVKDGLWIGDQNGIHFIGDAGSSQEYLIHPANYGAVKGTAVKAQGQSTSLDFLQGAGVVVFFMGQRGICVGAPGGVFANLTEGKIDFRNANDKTITFLSGAGTIIKGHYIAMMDRMSVNMNLRNLAVSQTRGWQFNSFCEYQGDHFAASSSGIFQLRGTSKDGSTNIDSFFEFVVDMGQPCSLLRLYAEGEFNGFMKLTCTSSASWKGGGPAISRSYILKPNSLGRYQDSLKTDLDEHNGVGQYWTFRIDNYNGSDFSIDRLKVEPEFHHFN